MGVLTSSFAATCGTDPRSRGGSWSIADAQVDGVRLVDEVGFSGAEVSQLGCEVFEVLTDVRDVDGARRGGVELHVKLVDGVVEVAVRVPEMGDAVSEPGFVAFDV
jgi:hypothetical protein